jgi:hypothetical protein
MDKKLEPKKQLFTKINSDGKLDTQGTGALKGGFFGKKNPSKSQPNQDNQNPSSQSVAGKCSSETQE